MRVRTRHPGLPPAGWLVATRQGTPVHTHATHTCHVSMTTLFRNTGCQRHVDNSANLRKTHMESHCSCKAQFLCEQGAAVLLALCWQGLCGKEDQITAAGERHEPVGGRCLHGADALQECQHLGLNWALQHCGTRTGSSSFQKNPCTRSPGSAHAAQGTRTASFQGVPADAKCDNHLKRELT